jgi:hypothetical protein
VVGGDRVAQQARTRAPRIGLEARGGLGHALEEGRVLDVGRVVVPAVELALADGHLVPGLVAREDIGVLVHELVAADAFFFSSRTSAVVGQMSFR